MASVQIESSELNRDTKKIMAEIELLVFVSKSVLKTESGNQNLFFEIFVVQKNMTF